MGPTLDQAVTIHLLLAADPWSRVSRPKSPRLRIWIAR